MEQSSMREGWRKCKKQTELFLIGFLILFYFKVSLINNSCIQAVPRNFKRTG